MYLCIPYRRKRRFFMIWHTRSQEIFVAYIYKYIYKIHKWDEENYWSDALTRVSSGYVFSLLLECTLVIVPTALVRPSRNIILVPSFRYSGFFMKQKRTIALSPVRMCCTDMFSIRADWRILPQWTVKMLHDKNRKKYIQLQMYSFAFVVYPWLDNWR